MVGIAAYQQNGYAVAAGSTVKTMKIGAGTATGTAASVTLTLTGLAATDVIFIWWANTTTGIITSATLRVSDGTNNINTTLYIPDAGIQTGAGFMQCWQKTGTNTSGMCTGTETADTAQTFRATGSTTMNANWITGTVTISMQVVAGATTVHTRMHAYVLQE